jgi:hypothetical protein
MVTFLLFFARIGMESPLYVQSKVTKLNFTDFDQLTKKTFLPISKKFAFKLSKIEK